MAKIGKLAVHGISMPLFCHFSWSLPPYSIFSGRTTYKDRKKTKISNFEIKGTAMAFIKKPDKRYLLQFQRQILRLNRHVQAIFWWSTWSSGRVRTKIFLLKFLKNCQGVNLLPFRSEKIENRPISPVSFARSRHFWLKWTDGGVKMTYKELRIKVKPECN